MKFLIIGLGNYGSVLAEELTVLGHEVVGVDSTPSRVERLKDKMATSFVMDATDETALPVLPLKSVDVVIVAIGESFDASIRAVSLLKKNKVKRIYARAVDEVHKAVLEAFSLDRILTPERDAARTLVQQISLNAGVEPFQVDEDHYVFKFSVPSKLGGFAINDLHLEVEFGLKVIALIRGKSALNSLGISILERSVENHFEENYELQPTDMLVCYGRYADFMQFWKTMR